VYDTAATKARADKIYACEVGGVLPHSDEMMALASDGLFVLRYPNHLVTAQYKHVAERLMAD
jgi:MinD-like ATPase involved in chromosome partitioning or flagellar assembly